LADILNILFL